MFQVKSDDGQKDVSPKSARQEESLLTQEGSAFWVYSGLRLMRRGPPLWGGPPASVSLPIRVSVSSRHTLPGAPRFTFCSLLPGKPLFPLQSSVWALSVSSIKQSDFPGPPRQCILPSRYQSAPSVGQDQGRSRGVCFPPTKSEVSAESESRHSGTFRGITRDGCMATESSNFQNELGCRMSFYFIFPMIYFLLYFVKVWTHVD